MNTSTKTPDIEALVARLYAETERCADTEVRDEIVAALREQGREIERQSEDLELQRKIDLQLISDLHAARATVATQAAQLANWETVTAQNHATIAAVREELNKHVEKVEALRKYAQHKENCRCIEYGPQGQVYTCNCGLDAALAARKQHP